MLLGALMLLASCNNNTNDNNIGEPFEAASPARGIRNGNAFESGFFGIRLDLPDNWVIIEDENIAAEMWVEPQMIIPRGAAVTQEIFADAVTPIIIDLLAICEEAQSTIDVFIMPVPEEMAHLDAAQFLYERTIADAAFFGDLMTVEVVAGTTRIGHMDWHAVDTSIESFAVRRRTFANVDGDFARFIVVGYTLEERLAETLELFGAY